MVCPPRAAVLGSRTRVDAYNRSITKPLTGEPDAGDPPVRFGGRGKVQSLVPTPIGLLRFMNWPCARLSQFQRPDGRGIFAPCRQGYSRPGGEGFHRKLSQGALDGRAQRLADARQAPAEDDDLRMKQGDDM